MNEPVTEYSCPLEFFGKHQNAIPKLSKVALYILNTKATSVSSECLFSKASDIITDKRSRLKQELAEQLELLICYIFCVRNEPTFFYKFVKL